MPRLIIPESKPNFDRIIQAFQDLRYISEMRQRWEEVKTLKAIKVQSSLRMS
jgi:hypothetical protein